MHTIEPHYIWREHYRAEDDTRSPFYGREYSEFEFTHAIYDHAIHPQWDEIGSPTLFIKILFTDYLRGFAIIELFGEWNDAINNDIMFLKRDIIDLMQAEGINKFVLIGENVLNFHHSDDSYYEELYEDITDSDGWVAMVNFRPHVMEEFGHISIDSYFLTGGVFEDFNWRPKKPQLIFEAIEAVNNRLLLR